MKRVITVRKEVTYPYPPEKVWVALTDRHALAEWLMPNDFEPVVGRKFRLQVDGAFGFSGLNECEVLEIDPPRRMVWSWVVAPSDPQGLRHKPMTLIWTLHSEGAGTRLVLEHTGLEALRFFYRLSMRMGWGTMLSRWIPKVLRNVHGNAFTAGAIPLSKRCYGTKRIPAELTR